MSRFEAHDGRRQPSAKIVKEGSLAFHVRPSKNETNKDKEVGEIKVLAWDKVDVSRRMDPQSARTILTKMVETDEHGFAEPTTISAIGRFTADEILCAEWSVVQELKKQAQMEGASFTNRFTGLKKTVGTETLSLDIFTDRASMTLEGDGTSNISGQAQTYEFNLDIAHPYNTFFLDHQNGTQISVGTVSTTEEMRQLIQAFKVFSANLIAWDNPEIIKPHNQNKNLPTNAPLALPE